MMPCILRLPDHLLLSFWMLMMAVAAGEGNNKYLFIRLGGSLAEAQHGYSTWPKNLVKVLRRLDYPLVISENGDRFPNSSCAGVFMHDYIDEPWLWRVVAPSNGIPRERIFFAPFLLDETKPHKGGILNGTTCLCETREQISHCELYNRRRALAMRCIAAPVGVDTISFHPTIPRESRTLPIVYLKRRGDDTIYINETRLFQILRSKGIYSYTLLRTAHGGPESFRHHAWIHALHNAPFMIAFTAYEIYGNFIQEARACDVPMLLLARAWTPDFFTNDVDGRCVSTADWNVISAELDIFLSNLPLYTPRRAVEAMFGYPTIAEYYRNLIEGTTPPASGTPSRK